VALFGHEEEHHMRARWFFTVAFILIAASMGAAQENTTGSIAGRVVDPQSLPVPGAAVTVLTPQGSRTFTTDSDGRFFAPFLTPGQYEVKVELQGFKTVDRRNVDVRLGQRVDLTLTLDVGPLSESVQVNAASPIVDTSTTTTGAVIDSETLAVLPVGRRFSDTLYLAPGVSSGGQVGTANPSLSGGSGLENQYVVDGVNITNAGYGALGSYSIVFGSLGNGVPFDFIKQEQVKTGGYQAEFGQATGGVVNVITKSGSNTLRGSVFGYARPSGIESSYDQVTTVNGTVNVTGTRSDDAGVEIGGPILSNRLFFFGAVDPQWERTTFVAPEAFPLRSLGDVNRNRRIVPHAGKATWQLRSGQRIDVSLFGDPATGSNGPQRYTALLRTDTSGFSKLDKYGGHNEAVKYEGALNPHWLLEGSFARANNNIVEVPSVDQWSVTDNTTTPQVRSGGIGFYEVGNDGTNWQYQAKATNIFNAHQVRYGVEYEHIDYTNTINRTGPAFTLPDGQRTVTGAQIEIDPDPVFGQIYRVIRANTSNVRDTRQHYLNLFVQDSWRIGSRLIVNPGVRYERQQLRGTLAEFTLGNNWAPRIGATFDPFGKGRTKIYGNWGWFYSKIPNDLAARALSADAGVSRADYFDANLTQPVPDGTLAAGATSHFLQQGVSADVIDSGVKSSYVNEAIAGVEHEVRPGLNLGVRFIHRDIPRVLEDVQPFPVVAGDLGIPGATTVDYTLTNPGPDTLTAGDLGASFEKPIHRYNAIEVTADKRLANNWMLQASYRYARLRGTFEGFFRDDNGQSDPGITSLFDFPTNDPNYTTIGVPQFGYRGDVRFLGAIGEGPLPLDRPHQVKAYGNYAFKIGLNVGGGVTLQSGKPLTALAAHPVYGNAGEIPEGPRGSGFDTVDGFKTRTPFEYDTSLHADYGLRLSPRQRVVLLADVFNLFNAQTALDYDPNTQTSFPVANADFGAPSRFNLAQLQTPRQIRLGVRYEF
jgi:outer membrane receptor protein involved in Fe transport